MRSLRVCRPDAASRPSVFVLLWRAHTSRVSGVSVCLAHRHRRKRGATTRIRTLTRLDSCSCSVGLAQCLAFCSTHITAQKGHSRTAFSARIVAFHSYDRFSSGSLQSAAPEIVVESNTGPSDYSSRRVEMYAATMHVSFQGNWRGEVHVENSQQRCSF